MNLASWIIFFSYKEAQTITTGYEKEINPSSYTEEVDPANFYDQFNDSVLSETITKTVTDAEGNNLSVNAPKQGVVISSPMCVKLSENKFSGGTHERRKNNHMGRADPCLPE